MTQMAQGKDVKEQATINAPVEKVFAALADLETSMRLFPGVKVTGRDGDAVVIDYVVNPPGVNVPITFHAMKVRVVDAQEPTVLTWVPDPDGPIGGTVRWNLQSQGEGKSTLLTLGVNYQMSTDAINSALSGISAGGVVGEVTTTINEVISSLSSEISSHFQQEIANLKKVTES